MHHSDTLDVQGLKTKMITSLMNWCGWCLEKVLFRDVWFADRFSNWWDWEMNSQAKWITTCQTSINCGSKIWVNMIPPTTSLSLKPTLTSNTPSLNNPKILWPFLWEVMNTIEYWLTLPTDCKDKSKGKWKLRYTALPLMTFKNNISSTPTPDSQSQK